MDRAEDISDAPAARIDPDAPEPLVLYGHGVRTQSALDLSRGPMTDEPLSGSSQNWPHLGRSWSPRARARHVNRDVGDVPRRLFRRQRERDDVADGHADDGVDHETPTLVGDRRRGLPYVVGDQGAGTVEDLLRARRDAGDKDAVLAHVAGEDGREQRVVRREARREADPLGGAPSQVVRVLAQLGHDAEKEPVRLPRHE
ncbi:hypothetical protein OG698_42450 [Streptomyces sp. NBC_01003]|nr:hypothetical protein OG698_42450 [Streptomyces sp. NBC_01003]